MSGSGSGVGVVGVEGGVVLGVWVGWGLYR